jgi:hypothetical protein
VQNILVQLGLASAICGCLDSVSEQQQLVHAPLPLLGVHAILFGLVQRHELQVWPRVTPVLDTQTLIRRTCMVCACGLMCDHLHTVQVQLLAAF